MSSSAFTFLLCTPSSMLHQFYMARWHLKLHLLPLNWHLLLSHQPLPSISLIICYLRRAVVSSFHYTVLPYLPYGLIEILLLKAYLVASCTFSTVGNSYLKTLFETFSTKGLSFGIQFATLPVSLKALEKLDDERIKIFH